jgi:hypothetical protein
MWELLGTAVGQLLELAGYELGPRGTRIATTLMAGICVLAVAGSVVAAIALLL